MKEKA